MPLAHAIRNQAIHHPKMPERIRRDEMQPLPNVVNLVPRRAEEDEIQPARGANVVPGSVVNIETVYQAMGNGLLVGALQLNTSLKIGELARKTYSVLSDCATIIKGWCLQHPARVLLFIMSLLGSRLLWGCYNYLFKQSKEDIPHDQTVSYATYKAQEKKIKELEEQLSNSISYSTILASSIVIGGIYTAYKNPAATKSALDWAKKNISPMAMTGLNMGMAYINSGSVELKSLFQAYGGK